MVFFLILLKREVVIIAGQWYIMVNFEYIIYLDLHLHCSIREFFLLLSIKNNISINLCLTEFGLVNILINNKRYNDNYRTLIIFTS